MATLGGGQVLTPRTRRMFTTAAALLVVLSACGDDRGPIEFGATTETTAAHSVTTVPADPGTTSAASATTSSTTEATSATTTTTTLDPIDQLLQTDFADLESIPSGEAAVGADAVLGGSADYRTAEAILVGLGDAGIDTTGIEIWVWPVTGSDGVLLVMDVDNTAEGLLADPSDDLLSALVAAPEIETVGITRFVMNYSAEDVEGPFILTMTVDMGALQAAVAAGTDISDRLEFQLLRTDTP